MMMANSSPTPYPEVNAIVAELHQQVRTILAEQIVGLYLHGSLAQGDFDLERSDIDILVVTEDKPSGEQIAALRAMHARLAAGPSPWGAELEVSYIPLRSLRRHDPTDALHPRIGRGEQLVMEQHDSDWVIQRHVLREHGVPVAGPSLHELIDPVNQAELRQATAELMRSWWEPMIDDPARLRQRGYQAYAVLTMCRVLYTLDSGTVVTKPVAACWALEQLDQRWSALIESALEWRPDRHTIDRTPVSDDDVDATRTLIQLACEGLRLE
jgi:predicted nucleotidyltransferase